MGGLGVQSPKGTKENSQKILSPKHKPFPPPRHLQQTGEPYQALGSWGALAGLGFGNFPKLGGETFLGVPIIRIILLWGLYWGPLILGNYHLRVKGVRKVSGL